MRLLLRLSLVATLASPALAQDAPTSTPLDPRIDAARVTTLPAPRAGGTDAKRATPPEAVLRIARSAGEVPVDAETFDAATAAVRRGLAFLTRPQPPRGPWFE
ncbi:MAG: hypothetical protein ACO3QC_02060, partial [Phycisphaerales bacterium]